MIAPASRNLGKYEILQKLGRGGMADVYLALDTAAGHNVALKLIEHADDLDTCDSIEAERRGAELQARLADVDPHVVRIFDAGDIDRYFFVAMEYVDGQDLAELMRHGALEPEFAVDVAIALAGTLENSHNLHVEIGGKKFSGIVHGDIKPKNIRIDSKGDVRVLDFGIAKALSVSRRITRNEFGSVPYSSPERLADAQVDFHADLWALAVVLYEMVTGMPPYQAETTERLERMIRSLIPPPPAPDPCPESLRRILVKAMMPEPELRYASAREFADDLIMFRTGGPVRAVTEDLEATRRTARPDSAETRRGAPDDETRRTAAELRKPDEGLEGPPVKPRKTPHPWMRYASRAALGLTGVLLAYLCVESVSGYMLYSRGQKLQRDIQTEQLTDPNQIWSRWTELSRDNPSSLFLNGPRKAVRQRMTEAADRVIVSYRNSDAVYENGWKAAHDELAHALTLEPEDSVRGKLRLTEGHLDRIDGTSHRNTGELNEAVDRFTEAQRLLPNSPDPALGLARLYVYGFKDIDKADQSLHQAEKHGFTIGNREKAQLADGYRDRADRTYWDTRNVRGLPQEKDQIQRARDDYQHALKLYQEIAPYGNANASIVRVQNSLESVNFRLQELDNPVPPANSDSPSGAIEKLRKLLHIWR
jgi:serine/threonine protein kinase